VEIPLFELHNQDLCSLCGDKSNKEFNCIANGMKYTAVENVNPVIGMAYWSKRTHQLTNKSKASSSSTDTSVSAQTPPEGAANVQEELDKVNCDPAA